MASADGAKPRVKDGLEIFEFLSSNKEVMEVYLSAVKKKDRLNRPRLCARGRLRLANRITQALTEKQFNLEKQGCRGAPGSVKDCPKCLFP